MCGEDTPFCERTRLNELHERTKAAVLNHFRSRRNIHGGDDKKRLDAYVNGLNTDINRLYDAYLRINSSKVGYPRHIHSS